MSLANLVQMVRTLRMQDRAAKGLDWNGCARLVLFKQFGVEPTSEEVEELAMASEVAAKADDGFFEGWKRDQEDAFRWPTGGGDRVIRKSEPFGG